MEKSPSYESRSNDQSGRIENEETDTPLNMGRRQFLKKAASLAVVSAVGGQPLLEVVREVVSPEQLEGELQEYKDALKKEYGVSLNFDVIENEQEKSLELSLAEKNDFAHSVLQALRMYPHEYVACSKLAEIRGVKWYENDSIEKPMLTTIGGYFEPSNPTCLVINKEHPFLYMMRDMYGWRNDFATQAVFHHEFYHQFDEHSADEVFNEEWLQFSTELGAKFLGPEEQNKIAFEKKGFATAYGSSSPVEDRAEIAAGLLTNLRKLVRRAENDPALKMKMERIKKEFLKKSNGLMDDVYWELAMRGNVFETQKYFEVKRNQEPA